MKFKNAIMLIGESTRMRDKPFINILGKPMFLHGYDVMAGLFENIIFVCADSVIDKLKKLPGNYNFNINDVRLVRDSENKGPVNAMYLGMKFILENFKDNLNDNYKCKNESSVFVTSCDMPLLNRAVIRHIGDLARGADKSVIIINGKFFEPLCAFYNIRDVTGALSKSRGAQNLSFRDLINIIEIVPVDVRALKKYDPDLLSLVNVNTEDDTTKIRKLIIKINIRA